MSVSNPPSSKNKILSDTTDAVSSCVPADKFDFLKLKAGWQHKKWGRKMLTKGECWLGELDLACHAL